MHRGRAPVDKCDLRLGPETAPPRRAVDDGLPIAPYPGREERAGRWRAREDRGSTKRPSAGYCRVILASSFKIAGLSLLVRPEKRRSPVERASPAEPRFEMRRSLRNQPPPASGHLRLPAPRSALACEMSGRRWAGSSLRQRAVDDLGARAGEVDHHLGEFPDRETRLDCRG